MTTQDMQPEAARRLRELGESRQLPGAPSIDQLIAAFMAGAKENETRQLARQILAGHREFFDMIGDR
ncbi:hypothetical protein [Actinoplanes sp. URMC 104]|uniref:hypothetical protein n=1 Tax=Actinoplanes sp. URMC 104 TaxID=3423409 RepID=UPI003F1AB5C1